MLRSAIAVGPELARAGERGVGDTVLGGRAGVAPRGAGEHEPRHRAAARAAGAGGARRRAAARAARRRRWARSTLADARAAYAAIRLAGAGGLDERVEHDVRSEPTVGLREAMASAAARDSIAAEYVERLRADLRDRAPGARRRARRRARPSATRSSSCTCGCSRAAPDTLIARKRGAEAAARVSAGARDVLAAGGVRTAAGRRALRSFDASLREPGNALNPGTTADLVTATLFVALLEGML